MKYNIGKVWIDQTVHCISYFYRKSIFSFVLKNMNIELKPINTIQQAGMTNSMLMANNEQC